MHREEKCSCVYGLWVGKKKEKEKSNLFKEFFLLWGGWKKEKEKDTAKKPLGQFLLQRRVCWMNMEVGKKVFPKFPHLTLESAAAAIFMKQSQES